MNVLQLMFSFSYVYLMIFDIFVATFFESENAIVNGHAPLMVKANAPALIEFSLT